MGLIVQMQKISSLKICGNPSGPDDGPWVCHGGIPNKGVFQWENGSKVTNHWEDSWHFIREKPLNLGYPGSYIVSDKPIRPMLCLLLWNVMPSFKDAQSCATLQKAV